MLAQQIQQAMPQTIGWIQALLQAGALGLLAYFLVWDLPRSRKEQREERERIDGERIAERDKHDAVIEKMTAAFTNECKAQREACDHHFEVLASGIRSLESELAHHHEMTQRYIDRQGGD